MTQPDIQNNASLVPMAENHLPVYMDLPLAANEQAAKLQYLMVDPATGMAELGDDAKPGMLSGGYVRVSELTDTDATAGNARARVAWGFATHAAPSTIASDTPDVTSIGKPLFLAPNNAPGLLSHTGTVTGANLKNRSVLGLALGIVKKGSATIYHWVGPIAAAVARGAMMADGNTASLHKVVDAGAATDTVNGAAEVLIPRSPTKGTIVAAYLDVEGTTLAASGNTDFSTLTIYRRAGVAGDTPVAVATLTTKTLAMTQWTSVPFTLSAVAGALDNLEGDLLTVVKTHGSSGAIIPAGNIRVIERTGL